MIFLFCGASTEQYDIFLEGAFMNIKKILLSNDCSYTLKYTPSSASATEIYSDSIELYMNNGKCHVLNSGDTTHALLHFFGLDTIDCITDGKEDAQYLYILLCSYDNTKELITKYIELCTKQPFLLIYLKGIHYTVLEKNISFINDLRELIDNFDCIKKYIESIFIKPYMKTTMFSPRTLMLLTEHKEFENGSESIYLNLFNRYHTFNQSQSMPTIDAFLDKITSRVDSISKNLGTDENESLSILYNETNSCDCRYYVVLVDFIHYMFENELKIKFCPNCGKYFILKYNHKTAFCIRIYAGTKTTCQGYGSNTLYRLRKSENPIHPIYITCYNKLYSRVRKGKLEKNSPLFQTLMNYRDVYTAKYEQNPSEEIVQEFKDITKKI